ncbi:hypothetical protein RGAI101_4151 [Roseobacter sp. GAI101]|nr:hypothetical protein RGAI101_4151 [Roseobacter sp. GAI101]
MINAGHHRTFGGALVSARLKNSLKNSAMLVDSMAKPA